MQFYVSLCGWCWNDYWIGDVWIGCLSDASVYCIERTGYSLFLMGFPWQGVLTDFQIQVLVCGGHFMSLSGTFITLMYLDAGVYWFSVRAHCLMYVCMGLLWANLRLSRSNDCMLWISIEQSSAFQWSSRGGDQPAAPLSLTLNQAVCLRTIPQKWQLELTET